MSDIELLECVHVCIMNYTHKVSLVWLCLYSSTVFSVLVKCVFMHTCTLLEGNAHVRMPKLQVKVDYSRNIK